MDKDESLKKNNVILGIHSVVEAIRKGGFFPQDKIYTARRLDDPRLKNFFYKAKKNFVKIEKKSFAELDKIASGNRHQGIVLLRQNEIILNEISEEEIFSNNGFRLYVIADGILDPGNIGAISRSLLAFEADGLIVGEKNSAPLGVAALKSSAGALLSLPVHRTKSVLTFIKKAKTANTHIVVASMEGTYLREQWVHGLITLDKTIFLVMGSEEKGVSEEIENLCDEMVTIPQSVKIQSLNVSVSTAILVQKFYEVKKSLQ